MRAIDLIVIHCSSTRENYALTEQALEASHRLIGFDGTGYHFYVRRERHSLSVLVGKLLQEYPGTCVVGHRDLSPDLNGNGEVEPMEWTKQCPCFDVGKEF